MRARGTRARGARPPGKRTRGLRTGAGAKSIAGRAAFATAALLAALALVAWRQSTTRETMQEIEEIGRDLAIAADEREELARRVSQLEARPHVAAEAAERLGLRSPSDHEVVIPAGGEW